MGQPFATQAVADREFFTDREREVGRVLEVMRTRDRLVLYGERRMGKSSVIARAAERVRSEGGVVLMADAWTITELDDLNRALMESVPRDWLVGDRLSALLRALRSVVLVTADGDGRPVVQFTGTAMPDSRPGERLSRILRGLDRVAADHERPVVVVIDEFQKLEEVEGGSGGLLRQLVQETPNLAYVFAGSIVGLVLELLGPKGPFHAMDRLEVQG
ncbi:MAG TPA: ATP-binding protein, partial [Longimicrobiales bacterium]|nr:ATP-binding protein [Longimicrobiales bacterium]